MPQGAAAPAAPPPPPAAASDSSTESLLAADSVQQTYMELLQNNIRSPVQSFSEDDDLPTVTIGDEEAAVLAVSSRKAALPVWAAEGIGWGAVAPAAVPRGSVAVPARLPAAFRHLESCAVSHFTMCLQVTPERREATRALVVASTSLYICEESGAVARCLRCATVSELLVPALPRDTCVVAVLVPTSHDAVLRFSSRAVGWAAAQAMQDAYAAATDGLQLPLREVEGALDPAQFRLAPPADCESAESLPIPRRKQRFDPTARPPTHSPPADTDAAAAALRARLEEARREEADSRERVDYLRQAVRLKHIDPDAVLQSGTAAAASQRAKEARIAQLEGQLSELQDRLYAPRSRRLSAAAVDELCARLTQRLRGLTAECDTLRRSARLLPALRREAHQRDNDILWMERANLSNGLPPVSESGAVSGVHGPWPPKPLRLRHAELPVQARERKAELAAGEIGTIDASPTVDSRGLVGLDELRRQYPNGLQSPKDLAVDPRTGLRVVDVPGSLQEAFQDAVDCILHVFAYVRVRPVQTRSLVKKVLLVSDQSLYFCGEDGSVDRCVDVTDLEEILLDAGGTGVGLRVGVEHGMLFYCSAPRHRSDLVDCLVKLQVYNNGGLHRVVRIRQLALGKRLEKALELQIERPRSWALCVTPLRTKQELILRINALIAPGEEARKKHERERERWIEEVKKRWTAAHERELAEALDNPAMLGGQLREQLRTEERRRGALMREQLELKQQIVNHVCKGGAPELAPRHLGGQFEQRRGAVIPPEGPGEFCPQAGRYVWIPAQSVAADTGTPISCVAMLGGTLVTGHANGYLRAWDLDTISPGRSVAAHTAAVNDLLLFPAEAAGEGAGEDALPAAVSAGADGLLRVWRLHTGQCIAALAAHRGAVRCAGLSGERLASGGNDAVIFLWAMPQVAPGGRQLRALRGHKQPVVGLVYEGGMLVSAEWGWLLLWDADEGTVTRALRDAYGGLRCVGATARHVVAAGDGGDISVWDPALQASRTVQRAQGEEKEVYDVVAVRLAGRYCVAASTDCRVRVWDLLDLRLAAVFHNSYPNQCSSFCFSDDVFVAAEGTHVRVWQK
eukprot:TRINITY_DN50976_c0_g1_i1.p1 TRINITY_DN50976_c0_g1~~TRINITY_DN50976_c0_g1_i1.p1  ORF type:complete len:1112 (+),score=402.69 TRINITY_DN50976_c0_g1_i1:86-3337(+)